MKMVRVIRKGLDAASIAKKKAQKPKYYSIWDEEATSITENPMHIPAPKMRLPGNEESYNPPEEYLPDSDELKELQERRIEEKSLVIPTK